MKILKEARTFDYTTQKEKMYGYETGTRGLSGINAMSEDKLEYNLYVCANEGYEKAKNLILKRMVELDLFTNSVKRHGDKFVLFDLPNAIWYDAPSLLDNASKDPTLNKMLNIIYAQYHNAPSKIAEEIFIALLIFLFAKDTDKATILKDELLKLGFDNTTLKDAAAKAASDKKVLEVLDKVSPKQKLTEDIEKHEDLNPKLWNKDNTLKPEVEEKIKLIVNEFLDGLEEDEIVFDIADVVLVGSNCSYNYTKDSDLDIHILVNLDNSDCPKNLYDKLYSAYRTIFNNRLDIDFYGIPVEIYVEDKNNTNISNGKYSVVNKKWIKEPVAEDIPEIDQEKFDKEFKVWEDRYNEVINMK